MEVFLGLVRLAFEQGWKLGLLFVLFFGGVSYFGSGFPQSLRDWSGPGVLFGAAVIIMSGVVNLVEWDQRRRRRTAMRREELTIADQEAAEVMSNLSTLARPQLEILRTFLAEGAPRFEVHILNDGWPLLERGILIATQHFGTSAICQLHPAIAAQRKPLLDRLNDLLRRSY